MKELLYGAAYYDEYMPYDRLEKDVELMKKAHVNVGTHCGVHLEYLRTPGRRPLIFPM